MVTNQIKNYSATEDKSIDVESELWEANPSPLYYLPYIIIGVVLLIGCFVLLEQSAALSRTLRSTLSLSMMTFGILLIGISFSTRSSKKYTITDLRVKAKTGMLSRYIDQIYFEDIKSINIRQNFVERIFNLGTIDIVGITDLYTDEPIETVVTFLGIPKPQEIIEIIEDFMEDEVQS